jgi:hypothetical protein
MIEVELIGGRKDGERRVYSKNKFPSFISYSEPVKIKNGMTVLVITKFNLDKSSVQGNRAKYLLEE